MTIKEMHDTFRVLAQQVGLQTVRAILPESIDVLINQSIIEYCLTIARSNSTQQYKEDISDKDNSITPLNSLRNLIYEALLDVILDPNNNLRVICPLNIKDPLLYTSVFVKYNINRNTIKDCRIIDNDKLQMSLKDYCNKADWENPICTFGNYNNINCAYIYVGESNKLIDKIIVNYLKYPNKVKFNEDVNLSVHCDLPSYTHFDIINIAVNKFKSMIKQ